MKCLLINIFYKYFFVFKKYLIKVNIRKININLIEIFVREN